jgi:multidrug resistance efflux pump
VKSNRVITVVLILGVIIVAVTFLGAAKMTGDDKPSKEPQKTLSPVKNGSRGVVVFGTVDVDNGPGLIPIFPENFPQPSLVKKVLAKEGQDVKLGDALLEFDSELADIKVREAREGLAKANATLKEAEASLDQAIKNDKAQDILKEAQRIALDGKKKELEAVKIELKEKLDKFDKLKDKTGILIEPELFAADSKRQAAQRALAAEERKLDAFDLSASTPFFIPKPVAVHKVAEAKAAVALQDAQLSEALYGKKLMTLTARADGKIVRSLATDGMTFGAHTRQPAFWLQPKAAIIVRTEVDQEFASRISPGQDARIEDDGNKDATWRGKVIRIPDVYMPKRSSNSLPEGVGLNETRVLECIVSVESADTSYPIRVGQRVKVKIGVE